jgi:lysophospholipase L1-like esterase
LLPPFCGTHAIRQSQKRNSMKRSTQLATVLSQPPAKWLAAANHGEVPNSRRTSANGNQVCLESRGKYKIGSKDLSAIKLVFGGYYTPNTNIETDIGNDQTIELAIEITGAPTVTVRLQFSGQDVGNLVSGVEEYITDPVYPGQFGLSKFAANTVFWIRQRRTHASVGNRFSGCVGSAVSGEIAYFSDGLSTNQVPLTGALTLPSGGASISDIQQPMAVLGLARRHDIAVFGIGDSIMVGNNDSTGDGSAGGGWFARGLFNVNSRTIPWGRMGIASSTVNGLVSNFTKRKALLKYYTHAIVHYGTNDMASGSRTAAQTLGDLQTLATALKSFSGSKIRHIALSLVIPRTTSTDSFATVVNQTPVSDFETGGTERDALNTSIIAAVGASGIDAYLDLNTAFADGTALDKWGAPSFTTDGVHPQPTPHASAGVLLAARAAGWI